MRWTTAAIGDQPRWPCPSIRNGRECSDALLRPPPGIPTLPSLSPTHCIPGRPRLLRSCYNINSLLILSHINIKIKKKQTEEKKKWELGRRGKPECKEGRNQLHSRLPLGSSHRKGTPPASNWTTGQYPGITNLQWDFRYCYFLMTLRFRGSERFLVFLQY